MAGLPLALSLLVMGADIDVGERTNLVVVPMTPKKEAFGFSTAALLRLTQEAVDAPPQPKAALRVRAIEQTGVSRQQMDTCVLQVRLSCWTRLFKRADEAAHQLLVLTTRRTGGAFEVSGLWIDLDNAQQVLRRAGASSEDVENEIFAASVQLPAVSLAERDEATLRRWLREGLESSLAVPSHGQVELTTDEAGLRARLDRKDVGSVAVGKTRLVGVSAGSRTLQLMKAEAVAFEGPVDVRAGMTTGVDARTLVALAPPEHAGHVAGLWTGVAVAAVGTGLLATAAAAGPNDDIACIGPNCGQPSSRFVNTCDLSNDVVSCSGRGVPLVPLGLGALLAGGAAAVTYGLIADGDEFEWWWTPIAIAAGGLAYGVTAAAR